LIKIFLGGLYQQKYNKYKGEDRKAIKKITKTKMKKIKRMIKVGQKTSIEP
jgi:3-methyladenine DNA glycosylase AlkD